MITEITMPKLTDTMEEGRIVRWLVKEGDYLRKGDIIAEIETNKADMELESFVSGILEKIIVLEGEIIPVGTVMAIVKEGG